MNIERIRIKTNGSKLYDVYGSGKYDTLSSEKVLSLLRAGKISNARIKKVFGRDTIQVTDPDVHTIDERSTSTKAKGANAKGVSKKPNNQLLEYVSKAASQGIEVLELGPILVETATCRIKPNTALTTKDKAYKEFNETLDKKINNILTGCEKTSSTAVKSNTNTVKNQIDVDCSSGSCIDMNEYIAKTYKDVIKHRKINHPEYWILYHNPRYKSSTISILHVISSSANIGYSMSIKCISNDQSKQWENALRNIVKIDDKRTIRISPNLVGTDILQKITEIINNRHVPIKLSLNAYEKGDRVLLNTTEVIGAMHKEIDKLLNLKYSDNLVSDLDKIFNMHVENSLGNYSTVKFGLSTYYINWLDTITSIKAANNEYIELLNGDSIEITNPVTGMLGVTPANSLFDYHETIELRSHIYRGRQKLVGMMRKIPDEKVREEGEAVSKLMCEQSEADIEAEDVNINESEYPNYVKYRQLKKCLVMLDEWYSAICDTEANR